MRMRAANVGLPLDFLDQLSLYIFMNANGFLQLDKFGLCPARGRGTGLPLVDKINEPDCCAIECEVANGGGVDLDFSFTPFDEPGGDTGVVSEG